MTKLDEFKEQYDKYVTLSGQKKKQLDGMGNLRLAVFLMGAAAAILLFIYAGRLYGTLILVVSAAAFIYTVKKHDKISCEYKKLSCMAEVNKMYLERMQSGWGDFSDNGGEFLDPAHPYTGDLDIFGSKSLFQWINVANTYTGRLKLKELLEKPDKDKEAVIGRQRAVRELIQKQDFCQELQCEGMLAKGVSDDPESLLSYAEDQSNRLKSEWIQYLFFLMPAIVTLAFTLFFTGRAVPLFVPLLLLAVQMGICAAGFGKNSRVVNKVYGLKRQLDAYGSMLRTVEKEEFTDEYLNSIREELCIKKGKASASFKKLENITNAIDLKFSPVLYFILNFGLLWDYHCVFALEDWKKLYGRKVRKWLAALGQLEALASLATPGHMYPDWAFPSLCDSTVKFSARELGHPLIPKNICVRNDFEILAGACIITGSNMSGKTTLLRTVGINLVLAYSGAPVFAKSLECSIMDVFTSMRIQDDLNSGISTFYAELLRIKMLIDYSQKKKPMIFLIDEIFKGTNSLDRIAGAKSVLRNLNRQWITGLASTHDVELCELENDDKLKIKNYHFTEKYSNNEIIFDYRLRHGRSHTTNARHLMKMVGIEFIE